MIDNIYNKYANLLVNYCLELKKDDKLYVVSSYLAEPLLQELQKEALKAGANVVFDTSFSEQGKIFYDYAEQNQLEYVNPMKQIAMETFDAYLNIISPFNLKETQNIDSEKRAIVQKASKGVSKTYMQRTGSGDMRRSLCVFPTQAAAQEASMSLKEYQDFVFNACNLLQEDPKQAWLKTREFQQRIVDYLNQREHIVYKNDKVDISFSTKGRTWINSDGRANMPSGEVYTSPVEDSVNGYIKYTFPSIYMGTEVEEVELYVENGQINKWDAKRGKEFLDKIFAIDGTRVFGEAAIGTNKQIQQMTKNILFDEKIGGTVHMAIGQSYYQAGGKNESSVHWDMITDMRDGGEIYADDELIYQNGEFII